MHIPMYARFLSLIQVCSYVLRLNYCQMFCSAYSLVLIYILNTKFRCLLVLRRFYFSTFPLFFAYIALLINLYNAFTSLSLFFLLLLFCVCWIQYMVLTIVIDWILICNVPFLVLILVSNKVLSSHNKSHTFLF